MKFNKNNILFRIGSIKTGIVKIDRFNITDNSIIKKDLLSNNKEKYISYELSDNILFKDTIFKYIGRFIGLNLDNYFSIKIIKNLIIPVETNIIHQSDFWEFLVRSIIEKTENECPSYTVDGYEWIKIKIEDRIYYIFVSKFEIYAKKIQTIFRSYMAKLRVNVMRSIPDNLFHPNFKDIRLCKMINTKNWTEKSLIIITKFI